MNFRDAAGTGYYFHKGGVKGRAPFRRAISFPRGGTTNQNIQNRNINIPRIRRMGLCCTRSSGAYGPVAIQITHSMAHIQQSPLFVGVSRNQLQRTWIASANDAN